MRHYGLFLLVLAGALAASSLPHLGGQSEPAQTPLPQGRTRLVPPAIPPSPFGVDSTNQRNAVSIEFRPAVDMAPSDRRLAADYESAVAEHAGNSGFDLSSQNWSYQQIVCPALPGHLFLQYTRNNGVGDVTVFSASIPRGQIGRVRIVPILKRSYSLFSPAPINALTISAFNHIRAEEPVETRNANWLGTGLCYAALAGAHPRVPLPQPEFVVNTSISADTAHMDTLFKGGEVLHFADAASVPRPMEWSMTFTAQGRLIKATHVPAEMIHTGALPSTSSTIRTWDLPRD
jgi:hypothetical protein